MVEVKNVVVAALKVAMWWANDIRKMMLVRWWRADVVVAVARIAVRLQAVQGGTHHSFWRKAHICPIAREWANLRDCAPSKTRSEARTHAHATRETTNWTEGCSGAKAARASLRVCVCRCVCDEGGGSMQGSFTDNKHQMYSHHHRNRTRANTSKTQQLHRIVEEDVGADCAQEVGGPPFPFGVVCGVCSCVGMNSGSGWQTQKKNSDPMGSHSIQPG
jgi:hypothetical protein